VVAHDNVHIPKESFPNWIWFVIEFAIVLAISALSAREVSSVFQGTGMEEPTQIWIFWGVAGGIFLGWYIIIRGIILKKPILARN